MHEIRKLDRVLNEKYRHVVADEIPVAALRVKLDGKSAHIARQIERAAASHRGREAHESGRHFAGALKEIGARNVGERFVRFEKPMRAEAARIYDSLGYSFVVEMEKF